MSRRSGWSWVLAALVAVGAAAPASAAPGLPRTYTVQAVDSPQPAVDGNFGLAFVNAGDVNGDGKDDLLVGTDEHGGSISPVFVISGATGSMIRAIPAPDPNVSGAAVGFGSYVGKLPDIGSCPGGTPGQTCPQNIGAKDGIPDMLVTALGVDIGALTDAGRAYVIDGASGAVLKKLQMPAADIAEQLAAPGPPRQVFGRTIYNPSSRFGPTKNDLSGPSDPPTAVKIGDLDGGGEPDIVVGASDYYETGATANPESPCAGAGPTAQCLQAGRAYVYYGETILANPDPAIPDDAPDMTIKNPAAQPDDPLTPVNSNRENLGYSVEPVGDLGKCNTNPGAGRFCSVANSTVTPDGKPDLAISSHRTDDFGMFDVGVVHLFDGSNGALLYTYHHPEPQPASLFGFSNYNQPAVGDLGSSPQPDVYQAAMRQNNPFTGGGKAYAMNGNFRQTGSPNGISFATFVDPTPSPSEDFGTSSAGIGDVFGDGRTEVMIGAYGPHNPGTNANAINDVHIFSALTEKSLQDIQAPEQQPGLGFGTALAPLGDLNGDGFLDFAVGAGLWDGPTGNAEQGRIYIFRSDNSPVPAPTPAAPPTTPGQPVAKVLAGRSIELAPSRSRVRRGSRITLRGVLEAFADPAGCQAGQRVTLQRRSPGRLSYRRIGTATTGRGGAFRLRTKVGSTSVYRARIGETDECLGAASSSVRVTAVRRR